MRPWSMAGMPLNFFSAVDPELIQNAFGADKYARLAALKAKYDPDNLFHLNQNIPPAPTAPLRPSAH